MERKILNLQKEEMKSKQTLEFVQSQSKIQYVRHLIIRPWKDGGMRPIFNLKSLNQFVTQPQKWNAFRL